MPPASSLCVFGGGRTPSSAASCLCALGEERGPGVSVVLRLQTGCGMQGPPLWRGPGSPPPPKAPEQSDNGIPQGESSGHTTAHLLDPVCCVTLAASGFSSCWPCLPVVSGGLGESLSEKPLAPVRCRRWGVSWTGWAEVLPGGPGRAACQQEENFHGGTLGREEVKPRSVSFTARGSIQLWHQCLRSNPRSALRLLLGC